MPHARVPDVPIENRAAYSLAEVASLRGLSVSGLYMLINRGQLRSARVRWPSLSPSRGVGGAAQLLRPKNE